MERDEKDIVPQEEGQERTGLLKQVLRWGRRVLTGLIVLFFLLFLLVQIPFVQNWLVRQVTQALSRTLQTTVRLDYIRLAFFDEFVLQGLYVADLHADTLLYSRSLRADFNLNPIALWRRGLEIEKVDLRDTRLHIRRLEGDYRDNLQVMLLRLFPPDTSRQERRPFRLNLNEIALNDVYFQKDDRVKGSRIGIGVSRGRIRVDRLDIPNDTIEVRSVSLRGTHILIEDFPESPLPAAVPTAIATPADTSAVDTGGLWLAIRNFAFADGRFELHNWRRSPVKTTPDEILDYDHLNVFDINIDIRDFTFGEQTFRGAVDRIALKDLSGFVLNRLSAREAVVSPRRVELNGLELITPMSHMGDTLIFKYRDFPDFGEFPDRVLMDVRLNDAAVAISDILVFAPGLEENTFFHTNRSQVLRLDGQISGRINNLRGRDLNIELGDGSRIIGNFSSRNLAVRNQEILNLRLDQLKTSMRTLRQIIPNFNPPANFNKLGRIDFNGYFDGFFADFVAYGNLRTDLGSARMDMRMNLKQGRERASYSGNITLTAFDLGAWTGNPDFGKVTFNSKVINGSGLSGDAASAILIANIQTFQFKGYGYENAFLEGELRRNRFDGNFSIQDDNIDFGFVGEINLSEGVPTYQFSASINKLDLKDLNLSEKDLILSGDVQLDLRNRRLTDLEGRAHITRFTILRNQSDRIEVDSIVLDSRFTDSLGNRFFRIRSDVLTANLEGRFDIQQVPEALIRYFHRNYPHFSHHLGIKPSVREINPNQFTYDIRILDSKGLNRVVDERLGPLEQVRLRGIYDSVRDSLVADLEVPRLSYGAFEFEDIVMLLDAIGDQGDLDLAIDSTTINGKTGFSPITLLSILNQDTLTFGLNYSTRTRAMLDNLNLNGKLFVLDSNFLQVEFDQSNLIILESVWDISARNYIRFGDQAIETRDFTLTKEDKRISLESVGKKGLKLSLINLDFGFIDEVWDYEPLNFAGRYNVYALVKDVFAFRDISATAISDTLYVNGDDWGRMRFDAQAQDLEHPVNGYLSITKDTSQLIAEGYFNPKSAPGDAIPIDQQVNYFDFNLTISGYPLRISEYFIGETVSNTSGSLDADLRFFGLPRQPNVEGTITAHKGAVTIEYLKTRYTFDISRVRVDNYLFDATGTILRDKYGHRATVFGGVRHHHLKDLGFSARLSTKRFLAIDTKKGDNKMFYGHALGEGEIWFSGGFQQPDIYVNATVGDSTQLIIPISGGAEASELNFIRFVDKSRSEETAVRGDPAELRGVSLEMDLRITEEAIVKLVFNEQAGDIIEGSGRGNIRILIPRSQDDFQMYGEYIIEQGDYLFTLYNVVNKNFRVRKGGTINWSGNPFAANIDLVAEYRGLNTSVANFVTEYLINASPSLKNEASNATDVNLTMHLRGELLQPIINFDISFPNLRGALQNYTDSKLRLLKQDQNELNKQVLGLIVAGQFIPGDINTVSGSEIIYNTVSEFVSNQLSLLLTELFSEFIQDGNVLSGIDFNIAYNQYQNVDLGEGQNISRGDELQVRLRQNFFNDRLSILVGGNIAIGNNIPTVPEATGTFVGNDLVIEYVLNKDRSLKLRVYQLLEPDIGGGRRLEVGTGLSYRREFESFGDFLKSLQHIVVKPRKDKEEDPTGER